MPLQTKNNSTTNNQLLAGKYVTTNVGGCALFAHFRWPLQICKGNIPELKGKKGPKRRNLTHMQLERRGTLSASRIKFNKQIKPQGRWRRSCLPAINTEICRSLSRTAASLVQCAVLRPLVGVVLVADVVVGGGGACHL